MREIKIGKKKIKLEANGATPREYRKEFGRDIFVDLKRAYNGSNEDEMDTVAFEMVENLAYIMARQAGNAKETIEEFLAQFGPLDIRTAEEDIISVWNESFETLEETKKK